MDTSTCANFAKAQGRRFKCIICRQQPPQVTFDYSRSGIICTGCQVIFLAVQLIASLVTCGLVAWLVIELFC